MKLGLVIGLCCGVLLGAGRPVVAQATMRIVAAYNGAPVAILADSTGRVRVVCE